MKKKAEINFRLIFHYISYLQYPLMLIALYFAFRPYMLGMDELKTNPDLIFQSFNSMLIFMGLAMSFSTLQDTTKTQNKLSKRIYESPRKGKAFIIYLCLLIAFILIYALIGYFSSTEGAVKDLSVGLIVFGLGLLGALKSVIEMFENHRLDKKKSEIKLEE